MEALPPELACELFAYLDFPALMRLYNASRAIRMLVTTCTYEIVIEPVRIVPLEHALFIFSFPNLRRISGLFFRVSGYRDVMSLTTIPSRLEGAFFVFTKTVLAFALAQRTIDLIGVERYVRSHWIYAEEPHRPEESVPYVIVRRGRILGPTAAFSGPLDMLYGYLEEMVAPGADECASPSLDSLAAVGVASPLFRAIYNEGEFGHVDPLDPSSPLLRDVIVSPLYGFVHRDLDTMVIIALQTEWIAHGISPRLCRWARMRQNRRLTANYLVDEMVVTMTSPLKTLALVEPPPPVTEDVHAMVASERVIMAKVRNHYLKHRDARLLRPHLEIRRHLLGAGFSADITREVEGFFGTDCGQEPTLGDVISDFLVEEATRYARELFG